MLKITVRIDSEGLSKQILKLEEILASGLILDEASAFVLNRIRTRFLSEVDPDGKPWIPSAAGIRRKSKGGSGTLFDTGTLFRSIQASGSGPDTRFIGTDVPYAKHHQIPNTKHIHRPFLGVNDDDARILEGILANRLSAALEG